MSADIVIRNEENLGYAVACNQGAEAASSDVLCMLNMDTEVQRGWLPPLLDAFDESDVAIVGPRILHPAGDLQTAGIFTFHGNGSAWGQEIKEDLSTRDVDGVTGACLLIRKDIYNACGGMNEIFWCGNEDVALCLSVREAGHRIRYIRESVIHHIEGASGSARWVRVHENVALLNQLWGNR
jgi:O-antigen biosynthesis protein